MPASTGGDRSVSMSRLLSASVRLCASVKAEMVHTSWRWKPTRNSNASTNSRWSTPPRMWVTPRLV